MGKANSATMLRLLMFLMTLSVHALRAIFRTREELLFENLALRQQVTALEKERPRPLLDDVDRGFWGLRAGDLLVVLRADCFKQRRVIFSKGARP